MENISVRSTHEYEFVWSDSGTGSDRDGSFWKPQIDIAAGELFLTFTHMESHSNPALTHTAHVITDAPDGALTTPEGAQWVWDDSGSGGTYDVWFFQPEAQTNYRCLGLFISRTPTITSWDGYRCVHKDWLNQYSSASITLQWDDRGSGANNNVQVLAINVGDIPYLYWVAHATYDSTSYPAPYYGLITSKTDSPTTADPSPQPITENPSKHPTLQPSLAPTISSTIDDRTISSTIVGSDLSPNKRSNLSPKIVIIIAVIGAICVLIILIIICFVHRKNKSSIDMDKELSISFIDDAPDKEGESHIEMNRTEYIQ